MTTLEKLAELQRETTPRPWRSSESWHFPLTDKYKGPKNSEGKVFHGYSISGSSERGADVLPKLAFVDVFNFPANVHANAAFIAACGSTDFAALSAEMDRMREALRFYASHENHEMMVDEGTGLAVSAIDIDEGEYARKALGENA